MVLTATLILLSFMSIPTHSINYLFLSLRCMFNVKTAVKMNSIKFSVFFVLKT